MGTEPAVTVINYLWNRLGEEAGAGGEAGNTEMETERFAYLKNSRVGSSQPECSVPLLPLTTSQSEESGHGEAKFFQRGEAPSPL